jgi:hypothetical protein
MKYNGHKNKFKALVQSDHTLVALCKGLISLTLLGLGPHSLLED